MVKIKRAYEEAQKNDGYRVLVDRLWPRGVRKEALALDHWMKELAPSDKLRREFAHRPENWRKFQAEYKKELRAPEAKDALKALAAIARKKKLTLVYGARDQEHNNAVVLQKVLLRRL
jgi:uncharacterized protein YeaO (DUF488 family)